jgi:hypothetical protein
MTLSTLWHTPDNWYGTNDRVLVKGFTTKKELAPYKAKLKKYILEKYNVKITQKDMRITEDDVELTTYMHVSMGPSWSCSNHEVTKEELQSI